MAWRECSFTGPNITGRAPPFSKLLRFALVSGSRLALDVGLFVLLMHFGLCAGHANFISASAAVTFVYFVSTKRVFEIYRGLPVSAFFLYWIYQVLAVTAASWAVDAIVGLGALPILAKVLILPVTFSANYLFLDFLTRTKTSA
jgi:putative flippase GtrA